MVTALTKQCSGCLLEKQIDDFISKSKGCKYGKGSKCKECRSKLKKQKRASITEEQRKEERESSAEYRKRFPEKFKWGVKQATYKRLGIKITKEEYDQLYSEQSRKCAICDNPPSGFKKTLCLDHCHDTLKVRGLLCDNCNSGLGKFKDNVDVLLKAVNYLRNHGK